MCNSQEFIKSLRFNNQIKLYHGSGVEVKCPDLLHSKSGIDFGKGFYLTKDLQLAKKWSVRFNESIINEYILSIDDLNIKEMKLDAEWLNYIKSNRTGNSIDIFSNIDIITGPIANDKLFDTLQQYMRGLYSIDLTLRILNCLNFSYQYAIKTEKGISNLKYIGSTKLKGYDKQHYIELAKQDRIKGSKLAGEIIRRENGLQ